MPRYIDAERLLSVLQARYKFLLKEYGSYDEYVQAIDECIDKIDVFPTADVIPMEKYKELLDKYEHLKGSRLLEGEIRQCEDKVVPGADICACCGRVIPEGEQVCKECREGGRK